MAKKPDETAGDTAQGTATPPAQKPAENNSGGETAAPEVNLSLAGAQVEGMLSTADVQGRQAENARQKEIRALAALFPHEDLTTVIQSAVDDTTITLDTARANVMAAVAEKQAHPEAAGAGNGISVGEGPLTKLCAQAEDAILLRAGVIPDTDDRAAEIRGFGLAGLGPKQLCRLVLKAQNCRQDPDKLTGDALYRLAFGPYAGAPPGVDIGLESGVGHTSGSFPLLLANVGNKSLVRGFEEADTTYQDWCHIGSLSDFKTTSRIRLSEMPLFEIRAEGEAAAHGSFDEQQEQIALGNYAKAFSYSRVMFVNDDLSAFINLGTRLGRGGAVTIDRQVYVQLVSNGGVGPTMGDSNALFHALHANIAASAGAPSQARIQAMVVDMMSQTGIGEDGSSIPVGAPPMVTVSGINRQAELETIINSPDSSSDARRDPQNSRIKKIRPIGSAQLELLAPDAWFGVADQGAAPSYEVAFLDGIRTPRTKTILGTTVDGVTVVVDLDWAIWPTGGWQGIWRNAGA